jgi:hypothetical protein
MRPAKGGPETEVTTTVTEIERLRVHESRSVSAMGEGTMRSMLEPSGRGTRLVVESSWRWRDGTSARLARLLTPIIAPLTGRQTLRRAKRTLERLQRSPTVSAPGESGDDKWSDGQAGRAAH